MRRLRWTLDVRHRSSADDTLAYRQVLSIAVASSGEDMAPRRQKVTGKSAKVGAEKSTAGSWQWLESRLGERHEQDSRIGMP